MPRTVLVHVDNSPGASEEEKNRRARERAERAQANYWTAVMGTIDPMRIAQAVDNALVGSPDAIKEQIRQRFDPEDRLMLWFDFSNHNNEEVTANMKSFMEEIAPEFA